MLLAQTRHSEQRAALLGFALGFLPLVSFVGAGIAATWALRRGVLQAQWAMAGILAPGLILAWQGDPTSLVGGIALLILVAVLRAQASWGHVLQVTVVLGALASFAIEALFAGQLATLVDITRQAVSGFAADLMAQLPADQLNQALRHLVVGSLSMATLGWTLMALLVARWYQARIWNPGGFQGEILGIRLQPLFAMALVAVVFLGGAVGSEAARFVPILLLPLIGAGLSLVHGYLVKLGAPKPAHAVPYILGVLLLSLVVPLLMVLAVADSFMNFRKLPTPGNNEES